MISTGFQTGQLTGFTGESPTMTHARTISFLPFEEVYEPPILENKRSKEAAMQAWTYLQDNNTNGALFTDSSQTFEFITQERIARARTLSQQVTFTELVDFLNDTNSVTVGEDLIQKKIGLEVGYLEASSHISLLLYIVQIVREEIVDNRGTRFPDELLKEVPEFAMLINRTRIAYLYTHASDIYRIDPNSLKHITNKLLSQEIDTLVSEIHSADESSDLFSMNYYLQRTNSENPIFMFPGLDRKLYDRIHSRIRKIQKIYRERYL
jgi:hypothetical protein